MIEALRKRLQSKTFTFLVWIAELFEYIYCVDGFTITFSQETITLSVSSKLAWFTLESDTSIPKQPEDAEFR
ncbi:hypothetical protein [Enterovibrio coralii]|uniref:Uncharacterized protein n=1 Tax=Enterovibrio coralii TaxID=294935 RepID=A0A135I4J1_9GAMM|nr:hypothetical protein [Enterovibrio coralii]KXF80345.1 hypothetical protein ATN88_11080 [Enterovibrio coralii]